LNASPHVQLRLASHHLAQSRCQTPLEVVQSFGAVQAQDYASALWAIGCRIPGCTEQRVEQAVADREIVRTWPMRGTLHFVPAADIRWMLDLLTPRIVKGTANRVKQLELSLADFAKARTIAIKDLQGEQVRTREAMLAAFDSQGLSTAGGRGYHLLFRLAMEGTLCFGPRQGKQPTFALLDEWVPQAIKLDRETALATLAQRFFGGHGPATLQDFVWWSGLTVADAKAAISSASNEWQCMKMDGVDHWFTSEIDDQAATASAHLLPGFDEYLLGYRNRNAVLDPAHAQKVVPGSNGVFLPMMVSKGQVVGTWKRAISKSRVTLTLQPFAAITKADSKAFANAANRFGDYLGLAAEVAVSKLGETAV